nr:hypothetical protein [Tanacetum cinerariifolium]
MDRLAPLALFTQLRAMDYDQLYSEFNVGATQQVCLGAEVRMRAKHTLGKKEVEAAEVISLRIQLFVVGAADAAKSTELRDLKEKTFALEGERDALSEKVATLESVTTSNEAELTSLSSQVTKLTADLSGFRLSHDELNSKVASLESERDYPTTQDGLKAGIDHGKAGRDLSMVEAYDPSAEGKYVDAVNALGAVDLSLLSELESKKDASIVDLMDSLRLEGVLAKIPGAEDLQPSPAQRMLPIHRPEDNVVFTETSLSSSLEIVSLRVQRFREEAKEKRLSLTDVMTPYVEPFLRDA